MTPTLLASLADIRDVVVIIYGVMGVILMFALAIAAFGVWFAVRALSRSVRGLLDDQVKATLTDVQETVHNVRGTSEFMADSAVHPLIRTIAVARGVRKGVASVAGIRNRTRSK